MRWGEDFIYPWAKWVKQLWGLRTTLNNKLIDMPLGVAGFFLFILNNMIGVPIAVLLTIPMAILHMVEWPFAYLTNNSVDKKTPTPFIAGIMLLVFPIIFTWGLPMIIWNTIKERRDKKTIKQTEERFNRIEQYWQDQLSRDLITRGRKDFKPIKQIKQHTLL
jgi:hypothetical protein